MPAMPSPPHSAYPTCCRISLAKACSRPASFRSTQSCWRSGGEAGLVPPEARKDSSGRHAFLVAAGILISRLVGLVRQGVFPKYFGLSDAGDAFTAAFRVPNLLQNLFGEGVLSASFIPVYAKLLAEGDEEESRRVAGAVGAILALVASLVVLVGILTTPYLIFAIAPGFEGEKRELTIRLVRVLFQIGR